MEKEVRIVGAGLAGVIANSMLGDRVKNVFEANSKSLPSQDKKRKLQVPNVLRFRSKDVFGAVNLPFKQVFVQRFSVPWRGGIQDQLAYSKKVVGQYTTLRSMPDPFGERPLRYVAEESFYAELVGRAKIVRGWMADPFRSLQNFMEENLKKHLIISTLPMPLLMKVLGWEPRSKFTSRPAVHQVARWAEADCYFSLYVPDPDYKISRISMTGDLMFIEHAGWPDALINIPMTSQDITNTEEEAKISKQLWREVIEILNFVEFMQPENPLPDDLELTDSGCPKGFEILQTKTNKFAKIAPINEDERRSFILWATRQHNVYSLGRFATWRPKLLLDDLVKDVRIIQQMINYLPEHQGYFHEAEYDSSKKGGNN